MPDLGQELAAGEVDARIVDRALELLADEGAWNAHDERICTDDSEGGAFSLFCALYVASVEVAARYLHRRPAMEVTREVVAERAPERIVAHTLRDFNNSGLTTHRELLDVLREARSRLRGRP